MKKEIDIAIEDELFKDKFSNFYNRNKKKIISIFIILFFIPIFFQSIIYFQEKNKEKLIAEYLKAEMLFRENSVESVKILNNLVLSKNSTVVSLAANRLIEIYINDGDIKNAKKIISKTQSTLDNKILIELISIKKVLLNFENIKEDELISLLKTNKNNIYFESARKKLLYDYYIKTNQILKANQIYK